MAFTPFPGSPDYTQGNVPNRPEVPSRAFTPKELFVADNTLRRYAAHRQGAPEWRPLSEVRMALSIVRNACQGACFCQILTQCICCQTVADGTAALVPDEKVICDPRPSMNIGSVGRAAVGQSGATVFQFTDNASYNPQFAPE